MNNAAIDNEHLNLQRSRILALKDMSLREVWDAEDIAIYLKCEKITVLNKYSKSDSFPRPVDGDGETHRKWKKNEVIEWIKRRG